MTPVVPLRISATFATGHVLVCFPYAACGFEHGRGRLAASSTRCAGLAGVSRGARDTSYACRSPHLSTARATCIAICPISGCMVA